MSIYRRGSASMTANGVITGTDTNWQSPLSLIRVGATIVFLTNPIKMATISAIVSPTELRAIDTDGTAIANGQYIILLHDSITVDGLAQDVSESLRYYQSSETEVSAAVEYLKTINFDDLKIQLQAAIDASEVAKQSAIDAKASEDASAASSQEATEQAQASKASQDAAKVSADSAAESAANAAAQLSGAIKYRGKPGASITDVNQMLPQTAIIGIWDFGSSAAYSLTSVPEAVPGSLEVAPDGSFGGMQIYTTEKGNQYVRALTSDTEWSAWSMVGYMGNTITVASNLDLLVAPGRYSTASNTPVASQIGIIEVSSMNSGAIVQTFKAVSSSESESNKIYQRSATGSPLVWTPWLQFVTANLNGISQVLRGVGSSLTLGADGSSPMDSVTLRQMQQAIGSVSSSGGINGVMSTFIGDVSWWQGNGALLPTGYASLSGQVLQAADYPEIVSLLNAGALVFVSESAWQAQPGNRAKFSWTTGGTSFRMPDLNGASSGSIQGLFLRGQGVGKNTGEIWGSALPNVKGTMPLVVAASYQDAFGTDSSTGGNALYAAQTSSSRPTRSLATGAGTDRYGATFDASRESAVYQNGITEVRPPSATGTWIMRMKGTFSAQTQFNVYTSDAALVPNSTKFGGSVRSVYSIGGTEYGVNMKSKVTTNANSVTRRVMELSIDGATGVVEITQDGGIGMGGGFTAQGNCAINGVLTFGTKAQGSQSARAMGLGGATNRMIVPISDTQAVVILSAAQAPTTNGSGDASIGFPFAFTSISNVVICNGNMGAAAINAGVINSIRVGGFDFRAYQMGGAIASNATMQINYIAIGLINL